MDQQSALSRSGMFLMAASLAIALFVATQAIAAPDESLAARTSAWSDATQAPGVGVKEAHRHRMRVSQGDVRFVRGDVLP
jgi:hypothetical protein